MSGIGSNGSINDSGSGRGTPTSTCQQASNNKMKDIADILTRKREGQEWTKEEIYFFVTEIVTGTIKEGQLGAWVTAIDLKGISDDETENIMRAMVTSGQRLEWPEEWIEKVASLQSIGHTGNKAKPIIAPAMAACGLKFPILSSRGIDVFGGIIYKMKTIPEFNANKTWEEICKQLSKVGCCVVLQPETIIPAEGAIRTMTQLVGVTRNNSLKAACLMARICAMNLHACVLEITWGPSAAINSRDEGEDLVKKLKTLAEIVDVKLQILLLHVDSPVGRMIGQTLEVAEAVKCLNGEGPKDLHELVCKLGGRVLVLAGEVETVEEGEARVEKVLADGTAKKKFMDMLCAQGVDKHDVKHLFKKLKNEDELPSVLPAAKYFTHLSTEDEGYVHRISMEHCSKVMFELGSASDQKNPACGGIQLMVHIGTQVKKGQCWARIHHNKRLSEEQVERLKSAISVQSEEPSYKLNIEIQEVS